MKTLKLLYAVFQLLPLAMTLAALPYLPQQIPAHYGFGGQVDRWGSKYEALILPVIVIVFGLAMRWVARRAARQQQGGGNEKVCLLVGALSLLLFAFSTLLGWSYYGERAVEYVFGPKALPYYKAIYIGGIVVGCVAQLDLVWQLSDNFNGLMALPNLVAVLWLSPQVFRETRRYFAAKKSTQA